MSRIGRILIVAWALFSAVLAAQRPGSSATIQLAKTAEKPLSDPQVFIRIDRVTISNPERNPPRSVYLRFGHHALRSDYGGSFFVSTGTACTATLIGPQVLLTAQHCIPGAGDITLVDSGDLVAHCVKYSYFAESESKTSWEDLALCWVENVIPLTKYETITVDPSFSKTGDQVLVGGYGLTETGGAVGDIFVVGDATIVDRSPDMLTTSGAQAQIGDSGGAVFSVPVQSQRRLVVAVMNQENLVDDRTSYAAALSSPNAGAFLQWWRQQQLQTFNRTIDICGVTQTGASCQ